MSGQDNTKKLMTINSICSLLRFSGEGVVKFLNNLLISDLNTLNENQYHYTALCNPKGRIISSLWIEIVNEKHINLICPSNMLEDLTSFFTMRIFRLKINVTTESKIILIDKIRNLIQVTNNNKNPYKTCELYDFYDFMFNQELPWIKLENTEVFIPQHVNLDKHNKIMSFTKGCYPGQEIIARLKYLGKIKKRMALINNISKKNLIEQVKKQKNVSPIIYLESENSYYIQTIVRNI